MNPLQRAPSIQAQETNHPTKNQNTQPTIQNNPLPQHNLTPTLAPPQIKLPNNLKPPISKQYMNTTNKTTPQKPITITPYNPYTNLTPSTLIPKAPEKSTTHYNI